MEGEKRLITVIQRKIVDLKPYINNPRKNDDAVLTVEKSIKEFGFINPIVLDNNDSIIVGHTRLKAAIKLGYEEVPTIKVDDLTPEQVKAFRIMDNKSGEKAEWDWSLLKEELYSLEDTDSFDYTGLEPEEVTEVWEMAEGDKEVVEDNFEPPKEAKYKIAQGEVWALGEHRLMCGDSTDFAMVKTLIAADTVDMVFTDPPYNVSFNGRSGKFEVIKNDNLSKKDFEQFILKFLAVIKEINANATYMCCNWKFYDILMRELPYKSCIVWAKNNFGLGHGYRHQHEFILFNGYIHKDIKNESDLWQISKDAGQNYEHPTQKPIQIPARAIKNSSLTNQTVLDLFGGSGSTLIACEQTNRKCCMMELDEYYCSVIIERWEKLTNKKAVKL